MSVVPVFRSRVYNRPLFFKKKRRVTLVKRFSDESKFAEVLMAARFMDESTARRFHQDLKRLFCRFGGVRIQISAKVY